MHKKADLERSKSFRDKRDKGDGKAPKKVFRGAGISKSARVEVGTSFADKLAGKAKPAAAPKPESKVHAAHAAHAAPSKPAPAIPEKKAPSVPEKVENPRKARAAPKSKAKVDDDEAPIESGIQMSKGSCIATGNGRCSTTQKPGSLFCEWHACRVPGCCDVGFPELCAKHIMDQSTKACRSSSCSNHPDRGRVLCADHLSSIALVMKWKIRIG
jgi:hypothetical protein